MRRNTGSISRISLRNGRMQNWHCSVTRSKPRHSSACLISHGGRSGRDHVLHAGTSPAVVCPVLLPKSVTHLLWTCAAPANGNGMRKSARETCSKEYGWHSSHATKPHKEDRAPPDPRKSNCRHRQAVLCCGSVVFNRLSNYKNLIISYIDVRLWALFLKIQREDLKSL